MNETLVAEDLRKVYDDTVALDGVSLSVRSGEVFGLIGPNGAGKTTFVRALTGTTPTEGRVSVLGTTPTSVERSRIGLLPQAFDPPDRLTARELVAYYAGLYDDARDPDAVLADVGIDDAAADTRYANLSGGQQRRVCVATTLVNDPELLFLDEPTTGIDPAGRRSMWDLFEGLTDRGTTIFLTTHYMAEAERLADRVGLLSAGELVAVGTPTDLVHQYGGESRLIVETETPLGDDLPFPVERTSRGFVVRGVEPAEIGTVVAELDRLGVSYGELTWTQPDLEDVYLRLAGDAPQSGERAEVAAAGGGR